MTLFYQSLFAVIFLILFCVALRSLFRAAMEPIDMTRKRQYSITALRVERFYRVVVWAVVAAGLCLTMVMGFVKFWQLVP